MALSLLGMLSEMTRSFCMSLLIIFSIFNICYETTSARVYNQERKFVNVENISKDDYDYDDVARDKDLAKTNDVSFNQNLDDFDTFEDNYLENKRKKLSKDFTSQNNEERKHIPRLINIDIDAPNVELDDIDEIKINRNVKKHSDKKEQSTDAKQKLKPKKYRFPFFSKNIYFNKTEELKPIIKKPNKQRLTRYNTKENMKTASHFEENDDFKIKLEDESNTEYPHKSFRVNKRHYVERLCPECRKIFNLKSEDNTERTKRGCHSFIHNSRQYFQLKPNDNIITEIRKLNYTEPKQQQRDSIINSDFELDYDNNPQEQQSKIFNPSYKDRQIEELNEIQKTIDNVKIYETPKKDRKKRRIWDSNRIEMQKNTYPKYIESGHMDLRREQDRIIRELNEIQKQIDQVQVKKVKIRNRKKRFYSQAEKQRQLEELDDIEDRISSLKTPVLNNNMTTIKSL